MALKPKVRPYPSNGKVKPWSGEARLDAGELPLFDSIVTEHIRIAGTRIDYYSLDIESSERDPVYDEVVVRKWIGPYQMHGWVEFPEATTAAGEEGYRVEWHATAYIARKEFDDLGAPAPDEGSILRIWDMEVPFFN